MQMKIKSPPVFSSFIGPKIYFYCYDYRHEEGYWK